MRDFSVRRANGAIHNGEKTGWIRVDLGYSRPETRAEPNMFPSRVLGLPYTLSIVLPNLLLF